MSTAHFPEEVKILSWNYDYQVEMASTFLGEMEDIVYRKSGTFEYSLPIIKSYPSIDPAFTEYNMLSIIHLNGLAGFFEVSDGRKGSVFQPSQKKDISTFLKDITTQNMSENMHFAWESGNYHNNLLDHTLKMIEHSDILVVIGYSFPFFNREVDKKVFQKLTMNPSFKTIYYQDPILDGQQLYTQFNLSPEEIRIHHISQTENFHIPFEY